MYEQTRSALHTTKDMDSSALAYETSENVFLFVFVIAKFLLEYVFTHSISFIQQKKVISLDEVRNQTSKRKCLQELFKRQSKVH